jgi:hypothetical protein
VAGLSELKQKENQEMTVVMTVTRTGFLVATLALGLGTAASAAIKPAQITDADGAVATKVAEG